MAGGGEGRARGGVGERRGGGALAVAQFTATWDSGAAKNGASINNLRKFDAGGGGEKGRGGGGEKEREEGGGWWVLISCIAVLLIP